MHVCNDQIDFGRTYSGPAIDLEAKVVVLVICAENDIVLYLRMARDFSSNGHHKPNRFSILHQLPQSDETHLGKPNFPPSRVSIQIQTGV